LQQAPETDLSQKEVYQYSVPTFGKGVVFDVDYSVRQEQFRMFADSLRSSRLRDYVKMMVMEAEVRTWRGVFDFDMKALLTIVNVSGISGSVPLLLAHFLISKRGHGGVMWLGG
jgi:hypothetical protein